MFDNLISLLNELKSSFSEPKLKETLECLEDVSPREYYSAREEEFREAINGQQEDFYNQLAIDFVSDFDRAKDFYFFVWSPLIYFFDVDTQSLFFERVLANTDDSDTIDFINGLSELSHQRAEIALFHFNRINDYIASYFIAQCYLELENFENCIKHYQFFLKNFEATIEGSKESEKSSDETEYRILKYPIHNDLAYCYNRIEDYQNAYKQFQKVLEIFPLESMYKYLHVEADEQDVFLIDLNNLLLAIEKVGNFKKGIEVLTFAIEKYPHSNYFKELRQKFEKKSTNVSIGGDIIKQIFKTKKPFNLEKFEATKLLAKEKTLEDMIVEQIKYGYKVFGKSLEIYQDEKIFGRQYFISAVRGILDLLLVERNTGTLYVVELKRKEAGVEVVDQIEKYITGLRQEIGKRLIKGIICLHTPENSLVELVRTKQDIELFIYEFNFNRLT